MRNRRFDSVWDAIEESRETALSLKLRAEVAHAILAEIERQRLTQTKAAAATGVTQPRISDLMRGRVDRFSLDALVDLAARLGLVTKVSLKRSKAA